MFDKEVLDQDLERSFAEMASSLELETPDSVAPWGFVAVAAFTPSPAQESAEFSTAALDSQDVEAIWKVVEAYHNFAADVEVKSLNDSAVIDQLTKDIQGITTDPFYCTVPDSTYPVTHAAVKQQVEGVFQDFFDAKIYKPKSAVKVIPRDSPWLVGPQIAAVTYRTEATDDANEQLESRSFAVLFKQYGDWKLNILTSDVVHYQSASST